VGEALQLPRLVSLGADRLGPFAIEHAHIAIIAADGPGAGRPGITGIAAADLTAAATAGLAIKLIAPFGVMW